MEKAPNLAYESVDTSGDSSGAQFFLDGILVVGGILGLFNSTGIVRLGLSALAVATGIIHYVYLFRVAPKTSYFRYFWSDETGVFHRTESDPISRVSRYSWSEIVRAEFNHDDDSGLGLTLYINRPKWHDVPIYLAMPLTHSEEATMVINTYLAKLRHEKSNLQFNADELARRST